MQADFPWCIHCRVLSSRLCAGSSLLLGAESHPAVILHHLAQLHVLLTITFNYFMLSFYSSSVLHSLFLSQFVPLPLSAISSHLQCLFYLFFPVSLNSTVLWWLCSLLFNVSISPDHWVLSYSILHFAEAGMFISGLVL